MTVPRRVVATGSVGLSVNQLSLGELKAELERRVTVLQEKRKALLSELERIEAELASATSSRAEHADDGERPRGRSSAAQTRRANKRPLRDILVEVLAEGPLSTREAADAAMRAGYVTNSRNFVNNVGVAMNADTRFVRADNKWTLAGETEE